MLLSSGFSIFLRGTGQYLADELVVADWGDFTRLQHPISLNNLLVSKTFWSALQCMQEVGEQACPIFRRKCVHLFLDIR